MLTAAFLAAAMAWVINSLVLVKLGSKGISFITPGVEEIAKTGAAVTIGAAILWTHTVFGIIEAAVEIRRRGNRGIIAAWLAIAAHSLFGLIATWAYNRGGFIASILLAYLVHATWNWGVIYYSGQTASRLD